MRRGVYRLIIMAKIVVIFTSLLFHIRLRRNELDNNIPLM
jgi:hypothetical protein